MPETKLKIKDLAAELDVQPKEVLTVARELGISARQSTALLTPEDVSRVREYFAASRQNEVTRRESESGVIVRRRRRVADEPAPAAPAAAEQEEKVAEQAAEAEAPAAECPAEPVAAAAEPAPAVTEEAPAAPAAEAPAGRIERHAQQVGVFALLDIAQELHEAEDHRGVHAVAVAHGTPQKGVVVFEDQRVGVYQKEFFHRLRGMGAVLCGGCQNPFSSANHSANEVVVSWSLRAWSRTPSGRRAAMRRAKSSSMFSHVGW